MLYPSPDYVRRRRTELGLSVSELSRMMGYVRTYVGAIEREDLPVTRQFAERFWAVVADPAAMRVVEAVVPLQFGVNGVLHVTRARQCACGCGRWFVPLSWNHAFISRKHRRRGRVPDQTQLENHPAEASPDE